MNIEERQHAVQSPHGTAAWPFPDGNEAAAPRSHSEKSPAGTPTGSPVRTSIFGRDLLHAACCIRPFGIFYRTSGRVSFLPLRASSRYAVLILTNNLHSVLADCPDRRRHHLHRRSFHRVSRPSFSSPL